MNNLELLKSYAIDRDARTRNRVVEANLGLARQQANRFKNNQLLYDDLYQVAVMGLIRAVEKFSVNNGASFSSFAVPHIRGEILHYIRDKTRLVKIPRSYLPIISKLKTLQPEQVAESMDISLTRVMDAQMATNRCRSLNALGDLIADDTYLSLELEERVQDLLCKLEDNERYTLEMIYLEDLKQVKIAEILNVSPMVVNRYKQKALRKLRAIA